MQQPTTVTAATLRVPDATLHYEVRGEGPLVVLVGAPMDATFFAPLADLLAADHTVVTTDPRGVNRSRLDRPDQDSSPQQRADDLSRLLAHLGAGPATVFGSSGGAVTALALVLAHADQVRTVIAHEPPLNCVLPDRAERDAALEDIIATYAAGDAGGAWFKFMVNANIIQPGTGEPAAPPGPPPAERTPQQIADERFWFLHEMRGTARWEPDIAALRAVGSRIVVGVGAESTGQFCDRTSAALAAALGTEPTVFPGGHIAFVEDPAGFAPRLREVMKG